ncbi:MAG: hypothetical protein V1908_02585 [Candidatus Peregrinibacteria bacterium]
MGLTESTKASPETRATEEERGRVRGILGKKGYTVLNDDRVFGPVGERVLNDVVLIGHSQGVEIRRGTIVGIVTVCDPEYPSGKKLQTDLLTVVALRQLTGERCRYDQGRDLFVDNQGNPVRRESFDTSDGIVEVKNGRVRCIAKGDDPCGGVHRGMRY